MATRNFMLTGHQQELIRALVSSGHYQELRNGLRMMEQCETRYAEKLKAMRRAVGEGWADIAAGRYTDIAAHDLDGYIAGLGRRGTATAAGS